MEKRAEFDPPKSDSKLTALSPDAQAPAEPKLISEEVFLQRIFVQDARQGCEVLFKRYYNNLCNHAMRFVYSKEVAEDIVNEVFANFWQQRVFEKINHSFRAYLYRAVRYRSYNYLKHELHQTEAFQFGLHLEPPSPSADEILHYEELCQKLDRIIQGLPQQCRRAFQLNRLEGMKYHEVAAEMNITQSAVERLISRALSKIRQELKEEWNALF